MRTRATRSTSGALGLAWALGGVPLAVTPGAAAGPESDARVRALDPLFVPVVPDRRNPDAVVRARRAPAHIQIDGRLTSAEWETARPIDSFLQRDPTEGAPASERTVVAVLYDDRSLYVAAWCFDTEPNEVRATQMQRDFDLETEDNFVVVLDPYRDRRNGYRFATNANGARAEALILANGQDVNDDWNSIWTVSTTTNATGWFVEMEIPFSSLKFSSDSQQTWAINFERNIARKLEQVRWQGWSRDAQLEEVSRAGILAGLQDIPRVRAAEFRPYAAGGVTRPGQLTRGATRDFGGDIDVLINPTLNLKFTVNPDFAQAESDRAKINLTRFSLSFPEKREFFLDGVSFFETASGPRVRPFYSRRIGIAADRTATPILAGARITGKQRGTSVGAMVLQTGKDATSPSANFSVVRVKQDIWSQSSVGFINTNKVQSGRYSGVYGVDFLYSTSALFGDKNLTAGASYFGSYTSDRNVRVGGSHHAFVQHEGDLIALDAAWERVERHFNPEVGFLERENYQLLTFESDLEPRPRSLPGIKKLKLKPLGIDYYTDAQTGVFQSLAAEVRPFGFATRSGESLKFNVQRFGDQLDEPFDLHDDIQIPAGEYWFTRYEIKAETFGGRRLVFDAAVNWGEFFTGRRTEWEASLSYKFNAHLKVSLDQQLNDLRLPEGAARIAESGGRVDFAVSPRLFGAVVGQWNNEDDEVLLNFRAAWNPKPGTDVYLVVNQAVDTEANSWRPAETTVLSKVVWRFAL